MSDRLEHPTGYMIRAWSSDHAVHFGPYRLETDALHDAQEIRRRLEVYPALRHVVYVLPLFDLHEPGVVAVGFQGLAADLVAAHASNAEAELRAAIEREGRAAV